MTSRLVALALAAAVAAACADDGAVTLPSGWNALKARQLVVAPHGFVAAPGDRVVLLNGIDGAPAPLHPELPDLTRPYGAGPEGARVDLVRIGTPEVCALALDGIYPDPAADPDSLNSYDFTTLDRQMASVAALHGARAVFRADFALRPGCGAHGEATATPLSAPALWAKVAGNVVHHLVATDAWNPSGAAFPVSVVELIGAPEALVGDDAARVDDLVDAWLEMARRVRAASPRADHPDLKIAGLAFEHTSARPLEEDDPDAAPADRPPMLRFIDACAATGAPLDVLAVRVRAPHPYTVARVADALRAYLDAAGLGAVELMVTEMAPSAPAPFGVADLDSAYLGAFEAAARIYLQDVPVRWGLAGRGPQRFLDGVTHADAPLSAVSALLAPSAYFDLDGAPLPAFMARLPMRRLIDHQRVSVTVGPDQEGMAVLAARPDRASRRIAVLIANANVASGAASVTYDLRLPSFVPPAVRRVDYRLASLDQRSAGLAPFSFSEAGELTPSATDGTVRIVRTMPIPGVHYLEIEQPLP